MKQNSTKPTTTVMPSKAGKTQSMQHGQHHRQQMPMHQQPMQQPAAVTYHQQQPSYQAVAPQQSHHPHLLQQQLPAGCIVLPSTTMSPQPQHTYLPQQPGQLGNVATPIAPVYVGGTVMGQQTAQQAAPAGFSTSAQQPRAGYRQPVQHHQPTMSQVQQRPDYQQTGATVADFVAAGAAPGGFSGVHQPYKQQPHRQQAQPLQSYQEAPASSYPVQIQSSLHPEGSTTEAQYFFDANCTMPVVQQQTPSTAAGCRNPTCTNCKSFKRH
ncbi:uncharacterized protein LOC128298326 [Anopheles moucheti]|uniref:uncharacterized protein LOC128298326 n=1 Tax=Anopheles moucheti TaxID=186751 RepID=UPI0022EFF1C5|nr:uncharacterized protein LOC128298326 [Anopheles moucheti]